jgi:hypothetical protein
MPESTIIQQELERLVAMLLSRGISGGWIGLELTTLGMSMLTKILGARGFADHLRDMAQKFDTHIACRESEKGYSSIG